MSSGLRTPPSGSPFSFRSRRPYKLMVDAGSPDEPGNRYFGSLDAAWRAYDALPEKWKPFAEVRLARQRLNASGIYWPKIDRQGRVQP